MRWHRFQLAGLTLLASGLTSQAGAVTCSLAVSPLAFGSYNPLASAATDIVSNVQITCNTTLSVLVSFTITLSPGNGTLRDRRLLGDRSTLAYQVYTDAARSQVWGDGTAGTGVGSNGYLLAALSSISTTMSGYGRIPARQNVTTGGYTDTLMVSVTY